MLKEVRSTVVYWQTDTFYIILIFFLLLISISCFLPNRVGPRVNRRSLKAEQKAFVWSIVLYCTSIQAFEAMHN